MNQTRWTLAVLLWLGLAACLDFSGGLEQCRTAGRCADPLSDTVDAGHDAGGGADSTPSATHSTVVVSPSSVPADGQSIASVTVTVLNASSRPLGGQIVTLLYSGSATPSPEMRATDVDGLAHFTLTSTHPTSGVLMATVNPGAGQVVLTTSPSLAFVPSLSVGGHLTNLTGAGLVLATTGEPDLTVPAASTGFTFAQKLPPGTAYDVTVKHQPTAQHCIVDGGAGAIVDSDVTTIEVSCESTWAQVAAGRQHVVGLKTDGTVWAWGDNSSAQLGLGSLVSQSNTPRRLASGFVFVAAGSFNSMAIDADGGLWVWGSGTYAQLGLGGRANQLTPVRLVYSSGRPTRAVSLGYCHTLYLEQNGQTWVSGYNSSGQLGLGAQFWAFSPVSVWPDFTSVAAGSLHSLGLQADGGLWGWGYNTDGETGSVDGGATVLVPSPVAGAFVQVAAGGYHSLGLKADGTAWAWGNNDYGQLGDLRDAGPRLEPGLMGDGFTLVAAGFFHSLGLKADGTLWAWGSCAYGQLGDGCDGGVKAPVLVGRDFASVFGGETLSLAIKRDGTLWAWGSNQYGQLGIGVDGGLFPLPVLIR